MSPGPRLLPLKTPSCADTPRPSSHHIGIWRLHRKRLQPRSTTHSHSGARALDMGNCSARGAAVGCSVIDATTTSYGGVANSGAAGGTVSGGCIRIVTESYDTMEFEAPKRAGEVVRYFPGYGVFHGCNDQLPMDHGEQLSSGRLYHLLPLRSGVEHCKDAVDEEEEEEEAFRSLEVLPSMRKGVWRVRLAIEAKQLAEILSEQADTEAMIERMRTYASTAKRNARSSNRRAADATTALEYCVPDALLLSC